MKSRKLLLIASFVVVAVPASIYLAAWSLDFGNQHNFWSTPGEIAERKFVSHNDGLNSLGTSIMVQYGVNSACWLAILCTVFAVFGPYRKQIVLVLLLSVVGTVLWGQYRTLKRDSQISQYLAAKPPPQNLSMTQTRPADEALILRPIAGYSPMCQDEGAVPWFQYESVPSSVHFVRYGTESSGPCMYLQPVSAAVRQFANASWAQYEGRINPSQHDPVKMVAKFENTIFVTTKTMEYHGYVDFHWVSGDSVVFIHFERGAQDAVLQGEFLKAYLEKYPSSL